MAKRGKKQNSNEFDGKEFFQAIAELETSKKLKKGFVLDKVIQALISGYKKDNEGVGDNLTVEVNEVAGTINMVLRREVVEVVENPGMEISLEAARESLPNADIGDTVRQDIHPKNYGRIAAQAARQVIIQGIREAEQGMVYEELNSKEHEIWSGTITRIDQRGSVVVQLGNGSDVTDTYLAVGEQVHNEKYIEGEQLKVYVVEVRRGEKRPQIVISRTHPGLVKRLFELEVPEIHDGIVEIRSIAREAGSRTKIAVWSADSNIDPIGACVGPRGSRVNTIVSELNGEKIDIIKYSEDPTEYIAAALAPSDVLSVTPLEDGKRCRVIVPDDQLSLAIGKEGQNARLAAKLTGFKIDIKPKCSVDEEDIVQPSTLESEDVHSDSETDNLEPELNETDVLSNSEEETDVISSSEEETDAISSSEEETNMISSSEEETDAISSSEEETNMISSSEEESNMISSSEVETGE